VYQHALSAGLTGWVSNSSDGIHVEFNADETTAREFYKLLHSQAPPLAQITSHCLTVTDQVPHHTFAILPSQRDAGNTLLLSPDFALCYRCQAEMDDKANRRYGYAFITCTHCGPRYSILRELPYDREHTAMAEFGMCIVCTKEYEDPTDRRYFSQTNSCPDCGVKLEVWNPQNQVLEKDQQKIPDAICQAWREGKIVALKGVGGYLLTCDAFNEKVIQELRRRKHRKSKPLAVMFPSLASLLEFAHLSQPEATELQSVAAPIVVARLNEKRNTQLALQQIAPGLSQIGAMLPYAPLYHLLLNKFTKPIVATSGNLSHAPIVYSDEVARYELITLADLIVTSNREIVYAQDDSVVRYSPHTQQRIMIRRSRGFAPTYGARRPDFLSVTALALGALMKNTFALVHHCQVHVSQYLGDTVNFDVQIQFNNTLERFLGMYAVQPEVVITDLHPDYFTSELGARMAKKWKSPLIKVQHHQAHFASVLGEHALTDSNDPILGVVWDGTGLGDDGQVWGGEFFKFEKKKFDRVHHFTYFEHFLGDKMASEPRLAAYSLCHSSEEAYHLLRPKFSESEWTNYKKLIATNTLKTSSVGRLFDAVASLLGLADNVSYEGEAALLLEDSARRFFQVGLYIPQDWLVVEDQAQLLSPAALTKTILHKLVEGEDTSRIAAWFHIQLVLAFRVVATQQNCLTVCFSGGVFQNGLLVDLLILLLEKDYKLCFNRDLSPNDENISFGQLVWYSITLPRC
jgi:hydrogenase maturation protein HypF